MSWQGFLLNFCFLILAGKNHSKDKGDIHFCLNVLFWSFGFWKAISFFRCVIYAFLNFVFFRQISTFLHGNPLGGEVGSLCESSNRPFREDFCWIPIPTTNKLSPMLKVQNRVASNPPPHKQFCRSFHKAFVWIFDKLAGQLETFWFSLKIEVRLDCGESKNKAPGYNDEDSQVIMRATP